MKTEGFCLGFLIGGILFFAINYVCYNKETKDFKTQIINTYENKIDSINKAKDEEIKSIKDMSDSAAIAKLQELLSDYK